MPTESVNPRAVFPNELGPEEVGVSLPMLRIRNFASLGISSSSSLYRENRIKVDIEM